MRQLLLFVLLIGSVLAYAPSNQGARPSNNGCSGRNCGGARPSNNGGCGNGGCSGSRPSASTGCSGSSCNGDQYWWQGNNSPFQQAGSSQGGCGGRGCPSSQSFNNPRPQRPQNNNVQPQFQSQPTQQFQPQQSPNAISQQQNFIAPPMGICPSNYVCVHWQLCRNGNVIADGTGVIDKQIKNIPSQVCINSYRNSQIVFTYTLIELSYKIMNIGINRFHIISQTQDTEDF